MKERVLIAGIGNIFLGDDAFGVEVVKRLLKRQLPDSVRVADFGIRGLDLAFALMDGYELAILVDATARGGEPGTIYVIEPDLASLEDPSASSLNAHAMDPVSVLTLVKALGGQCNRILVIGCEPEDAGEQEDGSMGLSEPVRAAIDEAIRAIDLQLSEFFNGSSKHPVVPQDPGKQMMEHA